MATIPKEAVDTVCDHFDSIIDGYYGSVLRETAEEALRDVWPETLTKFEALVILDLLHQSPIDGNTLIADYIDAKNSAIRKIWDLTGHSATDMAEN